MINHKSAATEQGCAELAERLTGLLVPESPMHPIGCSTWEQEAEYVIDCAATILSRLTVEELAGVIGEAHDGWAKDNSPLARPAYIAQALLDHITAETEVKA